jgi:hypothetical protein
VGDYLYVADYDAGLLVFERSFEPDMNVAQSTVLPESGYMGSVKLKPIQTGSIQWKFSADAGEHWQVIPDTLWNVLDHKGSAAMWQATLIHTPGGDPPVCTSVDVETIRTPVDVETTARSLALHQNRPNPFNPTTTISFVLPGKARVDLSVYNLQGQLVRTLVNEVLDEGLSEVIWNGTDARGNPVASGVYFYRLRAGKSVMTKKMILLK